MPEWREIGEVVRLQVQREPLKVSGIYRPGSLLPVERAMVGSAGMLGHDGDGWVVELAIPDERSSRRPVGSPARWDVVRVAGTPSGGSVPRVHVVPVGIAAGPRSIRAPG